MEIENNQQSLHLPHEIIEKILSRLPVTSLIKFRCVSKSWRSLINKEGFIKTHHQNSIKNPSFPHQSVIMHDMNYRHLQCSLQSLLNEPSNNPSPLYQPTNMPSKLFEVVGCYNGLVCIIEQQRSFYMWNPSTRISKKLPEIANRSHVWNYGFGWIESSGEYKVFAAFLESETCIGNVYSSKTKSWKTIGQLDYLYCSCEEGKFVGGKLHWLSRGNIVTFDFKSEVCGRIMEPFDKEKFLTKSLGVVGGCLCMVYYYTVDYCQRRVRVWVMKEYEVKESTWERVATLSNVVELLQRRPLSAPVTVGKKGEILVLCGSTFLIYYPQDNVFHCLKSSCPYVAHKLYVESLVSPEVV